MGLHSRAEDLYVYSLEIENEQGIKQQPNQNLGLSKALHLVLGHDWSINAHTRLKVEGYFQHLYNIPADSLALSAVNAENVFDFDGIAGIQNTGIGRNYGIEFTLERFLHQNFYYLATLSLYQSEFKNSSSVDYWNTRYNGNYVFNFLAGKEFQLGKEKNKTIGLNFKTTIQGGARYTDIDENATLRSREIVLQSTPFTKQNPTYFRIDLGASYAINLRQTTHRLSLNIQNVTNRLNQISPEFDSADW